MRKSELVAWYLDQVQDQIDSEEELLERKNFIEKIIDRLTYHVNINIFYMKLIFRIYFHFLHNFIFILGSNYNTSHND